MVGNICWFARGVKGQVEGSIPTGNNPPSMNGRRRVMGWGVLGCRPNITGLRVAGGMPGKPKRIRGCYRMQQHFIYIFMIDHDLDFGHGYKENFKDTFCHQKWHDNVKKGKGKCENIDKKMKVYIIITMVKAI